MVKWVLICIISDEIITNLLITSIREQDKECDILDGTPRFQCFPVFSRIVETLQ